MVPMRGAAGSALHLGGFSMAVATHCPYCAFQCAVHVHGDTAASASLTGDEGFPVNRGRMCVKGYTAAELLTHPERLLTPLVRDAAGALRPASWDEALRA